MKVIQKYEEIRVLTGEGALISELVRSSGKSCLLFAGFFILCLPFLFAAGVARADDADVLPKGVSNLSLGNFFYPFPTTDRFNKRGDAEAIAGVFDNRRLDSSVFSLLKPLDPTLPLFGATPPASIGDAFVKFRYDYNILDFGAQYGFTDRLTGGIDIPYYHVHNRVRAFLDSGPGSSANVGINNACVAGAPGLAGSPVIPLAAGGQRFTTEDVQQFLGPGLRAGSCFASGFGFKRIRDFTADGLGDITAVLKYQYLRTEDWRLAATVGARFPTGRQDDPDDLSDIPWSPGNYAVLLRLHHDYVLSNLWKKPLAVAGAGPAVPQIGDAILDFTFRYDWNLPTDVTIRISDPSNPITTNRERVNRKFGDKFEFEFSGKYYLLKGLSFTGLYRIGLKVGDTIRGHMGFPTQTVEKDTASNEQLYIIGVNYSLLPLYMEKKFPIPLGLSLAYRERFAGRGPSNAASPSQILKTRYINFTLNIPF